MRSLFFIAGEASGDLHASALIRALREKEPQLRCAGLGGDLMAAEGCHLFQHYREMAFMGVVAVLGNMNKVRRNFHIAEQALLAERPDALILIDYPSFNLKIAAFCRKHLPATRIIYYIPPKVWAWKAWRIHKIGQLCDEVLGIFPFEDDYYAKRGYHCTYVGNPTVDSISRYQTMPNGRKQAGHMIALLPGSRKGEIAHCLPKMIDAARMAIQKQGHASSLVISGAPGIDPAFYQQYAGDLPVVFGETYRLLSEADAAIVNSGTATLEAALLRCPQVPVYHIACDFLTPLRPLVFPSPFFTLPNIILQREAVHECIANKFRVPLVADELSRLLSDDAYRQQQLAAYDEIARLLGTSSAPDTAAEIILKF